MRWVAFMGAAFLLSLRVGGATVGSDWLQRALREAAAGAVIEVPAGVYAGPLVITQPVRLRGVPGATIEGTGRGHVVDIRAPDVELAGFVIRRSGSNPSTDDAGVHVRGPRASIHHNVIVDTLHGIYVRKAAECRITDNVIRGRAAVATISDPLTQGVKLSNAELCTETLEQDQRGNGIHLWNCDGHVIAANDIRGTRDGIYFSFSNRSVVRGNQIRDVRYGLHYMYSNENVFEDNLFTQNAAGAALMYSNTITLRRNRFVANRSHRAYGLLLNSVERTRLEENIIEGNTIGLFIESCVANSVVGNVIAANYIGVRLADSSDGNRFSANVFRANVHAVEATGFNSSNYWAVAGVGNYWQDALKLDLDRNGIADVPHREADLFGPWRRSFPDIGLLSGSPGERALRFMHARIQLPDTPGVTDERPLSRRRAP